MKWWQWYIVIVIGMSLLSAAAGHSYSLGWLLYIIPFNLAIYFLPTWFVVALVRDWRKKWAIYSKVPNPTPAPPPSNEQE